jgi:hypothetical protein
LKLKFCPYICTLIHDLFTVDVIKKSREIRLVEALATFPPNGKVLIPTLIGYSDWEIITKH